MTKDLKEKAIEIKGKKYVQVSDRILYFNEIYPSGCIKTTLISEPGAEMVIIKAQIIPDIEKPERYFTGYSQAVWGEGMVNKTAALENAETSAVGRALALMGIGVLDTVASFDEVKKAQEDIRNHSESEGKTYTDLQPCKVHEAQMKKRDGKNGGYFYDHRRQLDNGEWERCTGFGFPSEKNQLTHDDLGF